MTSTGANAARREAARRRDGETARPGSLGTLLRDRNRGAILGFEFLWGVAMPFVHFSTVLPGYLRHLDVANLWIGLVPALYNGAVAVVQPFAAHVIPTHAGRLPMMWRIYASGACAWLVLAAWVLLGSGGAVPGLIVALLMSVLFATMQGFADPHYLALIVAAVPMRQRARFFGLRLVFLGLGGIAGGVLAERVLQAAGAPLNFGYSFLLGGVLFIASTTSIRRYRERISSETVEPSGFGVFMGEQVLPRVRREPFRSYLVAITFFALAASGFPFLGLLLRERLGEGDRLFGLLGGIFMGGNLVMSWGLGVFCDRWGSRRGLGLALLVYVAGILGCVCFRDRTALLLSYLLAGIWMPGLFVAVMDLALRLAADAPAAEISAVTMAAMAPARVLGPLLVGAASDRWSYPVALLGCAVCAVIAIGLLACRRGGISPPAVQESE